MSDVVKDISDIVNKGISNIGEGSINLIEKAKLNAGIYARNEDRKRLINYLGQKTYELFPQCGDMPEEIKEVYKFIKNADDKIAIMEDNLQLLNKAEINAENSKINKCNCGYENRITAKFCAKCGNKLMGE